jgi:hypothetical protein
MTREQECADAAVNDRSSQHSSARFSRSIGTGGRFNSGFLCFAPTFYALLDDVVLAGLENRFDLKKDIFQEGAAEQDSHTGD